MHDAVGLRQPYNLTELVRIVRGVADWCFGDEGLFPSYSSARSIIFHQHMYTGQLFSYLTNKCL